MNIYDYAIQLERDGENYYRDLATKSNDEGIKNILNLLADEEVKHLKILEKLKQEDKTAKFAETNVLKEAKNIFVKMKGDSINFSLNDDQVEFYKKAFTIEDKNKDFYIEKANEVSDENQKRIFKVLAEEERKHALILDNLVEFVSKPNTWLENAEFTHLDDY